MDKKDDNKKPSKDKKKDKGKKDKKKKVVKKKSDDKISQSQIVNIKIGDLSKPKTRRKRAAPKAAPPPPQIQRQLQYLPSLAGQAPMIPPPLTPAPAPTPPPAPPPPRPPAPAAEPSRTGDFFSDASESSVYGTSYDLASATLDDLTSVGRGASRPSMLRAFNRPRSDSGISAVTDPTYADLDFDNFSKFDNTPNSRFGSTIDFDEANTQTGLTSVDDPDPSIGGDITFLSDRTFETEAPPSAITEELGASAAFESMGQPSQVPITEEIGSISTTQPPPPPLSKLMGAFKKSDTPSGKAPKIKDLLKRRTQQAQTQDLQFTSSNTPTAQPILGMLPDPQPQDLVLSSQKTKELEIPKPASDAAEERPATEPITEVSAIIEPVITTPDKGDVRPEDEATGGGGVPPFNFTEAMKDPVQQDLIFKRFTLERELGRKDLDGGVKSIPAAITKYNLINSLGTRLKQETFGKKYNQWLGKPGRQAAINKLTIEEIIAEAREAKKQFAEAREAKKQFSEAAAESPKKEAKKQGSGAAAASPKKQGKK